MADGDRNTLSSLLNGLAALVASLDDGDTAPAAEASAVLEEIRLTPGAPGAVKACAAATAETVRRILSGEGAFDDLYAALSCAVEEMQALAEGFGYLAEEEPAAGEAAALAEADREEFDIQMEVLEDLLGNPSDLNGHVLGVVADLFVKISAIGTLPRGRADAALRGAAEAAGAGKTGEARPQWHGRLLNILQEVKGPRPGSAADDGAPAAGKQKADSRTRSSSAGAGKNSGKPAGKVYIDPNNPEILDFITETREYLHAAEVTLIEIEKEPGNQEMLNEIFRAFHNVKGISGFLNFGDINELSHIAESLLDKARGGLLALSGAVAAAVCDAVDLLREMVEGVNDALKGVDYETPPQFEEVKEKLESADNREDAAGGSGEAPSGKRGIEAADATPAEKVSTGNGGGKTAADGMVKVGTSRLDSLVDAVGELVIANAMVTQAREISETKNPKLSRDVAQLVKITRELQELAMSMRMVSLKKTFQKMARVARDLAVKAGIPLEFSFSGEDTELDRNVVEEISSPLVHMVRNAVDHGIEPVEERIKSGKPGKGRVHLSACHEGGIVVIKIEDDGGGLNAAAIREKAIHLGLISEDEELSEHDTYSLIFRAGFSTAERVTEVSGRGVGMDVVAKSIENLRGRVDIASRAGEGTTFTIRLPLTLAIIDGMVVSVGKEKYIVPTIAIKESIRPSKEQVSTVVNKGEMVSLRGDLVPLYRLHKLFNVAGAKRNPADALTLIVGDNGRRCALMVDDLLGQQQVVIKSLGKAFGKIDGVSGGAIMGDGNVAIILDAPGLMRLSQG